MVLHVNSRSYVCGLTAVFVLTIIVFVALTFFSVHRERPRVSRRHLQLQPHHNQHQQQQQQQQHLQQQQQQQQQQLTSKGQIPRVLHYSAKDKNPNLPDFRKPINISALLDRSLDVKPTVATMLFEEQWGDAISGWGEIQYWSDMDLDHLVENEFPEHFDKYQRLLPVEKVDWARYMIVYVHGGFYVDADVTPQCPIAEWGLDLTASFVVWMEFAGNHLGINLHLGQMFFGAQQRSLVFKTLIDTISTRIDRFPLCDEVSVLQRTGPMAFSVAILDTMKTSVSSLDTMKTSVSNLDTMKTSVSSLTDSEDSKVKSILAGTWAPRQSSPIDEHITYTYKGVRQRMQVLTHSVLPKAIVACDRWIHWRKGVALMGGWRATNFSAWNGSNPCLHT